MRSCDGGSGDARQAREMAGATAASLAVDGDVAKATGAGRSGWRRARSSKRRRTSSLAIEHEVSIRYGEMYPRTLALNVAGSARVRRWRGDVSARNARAFRQSDTNRPSTKTLARTSRATALGPQLNNFC